ncbi:MAG: ThuA domain-containing protein [Armatimonadota bacterium]
MSITRTIRFAVVAAFGGAACVPALSQQGARHKTVLYFSCTRGFRHSTCSYGKPILTRIGEESGRFQVVCSEDPKVINPGFLQTVDCIVFANTTGSFLNDAEKAALLEYVRSGGAFVGIHAATDCHYDWPEYRDLIGGWFDGHPWNERVTIRIEVPEHPACQPLDDPWVIADEIYQFRNWSRDDVWVLMSLRREGTDFTKAGIKREDLDFGIAWCKRFGEGRVFYTALGHREEVWDNPKYQAHLLNGILWAMGEMDGPCEPHPRPE